MMDHARRLPDRPGRTAGALVVQAQSDFVFARHWRDTNGLGLMEAGAHRSASGASRRSCAGREGRA